MEEDVSSATMRKVDKQKTIVRPPCQSARTSGQSLDREFMLGCFLLSTHVVAIRFATEMA